MTTSLRIILFSFFGVFGAAICEINSGEEGEEGELQMPRGIVQGREGANFTYSISEVYGNFAKTDRQGAEQSILSQLEWQGFGDGLKAEFDTKERTFRLTTRRPIPGFVLRELVNNSAQVYGDLPFWSELEARDRPKALAYSEKNFSIKPVRKKFPESLAWFGVGEEELRLLIALKPFRSGTVAVSKTTAYCMCHSRLAIRILDEEGRVLWETDDFAQGAVRFALTSARTESGFGGHDLLIDVNDHGFKRARYQITQNLK